MIHVHTLQPDKLILQPSSGLAVVVGYLFCLIQEEGRFRSQSGQNQGSNNEMSSIKVQESSQLRDVPKLEVEASAKGFNMFGHCHLGIEDHP